MLSVVVIQVGIIIMIRNDNGINDNGDDKHSIIWW